MELSEFVFKLLLLFLPGIICSCIVDTFTNHKERTQFQFVVHSFVYGLISYGAFWVLVKAFGCVFDIDRESFNFLLNFQNVAQEISFREIFYVCIVAMALGAIVTFIHTHKLHFRLFRFLRITKKFGELDVWGYLMNSEDVNWVTVRDIPNNLMYDGWIQAFSDNSKEAEVLLGDVEVYSNDTGNHLYSVSSQYLSLDRSNIVIEVRKENSQDEQ